MTAQRTNHTTRTHDHHASGVTPLVVDAKGLAAMIGRSHRTVMVLAARGAWCTGRLPAPTYIGASVRTRCDKGRRWRIETVHAWLAAGCSTKGAAR